MVNLGKGDSSCLYGIKLASRSRGDTGRTYLGHEDILPSEAVERATIVVINGGNGDVCVLSQKVHGCHFGFGLNSGHESTGNPRYEFETINEGNYISLNRNQRHASWRCHNWDIPCGMCLR